MKKKLYLSALVSCLCCAFLCITACGSDDEEYDRAFTSVSYKVWPTYDLQKFYKVMAYYTDFNGVDHEDVIENTSEWNYREKLTGAHAIRCRVIALAKEPADYGEVDMDYYDIGYSYSIHWYKEEGGAHSIQPASKSESVAKGEIPTYLANHPSITIFEFSR